MTRRAALYARISKDSTSSTSIEGQITNAERYAAEHSLAITHRLIDAGESGGKRRDNAAEALRLLRAHEVDVLLVDRTDRFGRRGLADLVELLDAVDSTPGAEVVAISDNLRSGTPDWSLRLGLAAVLARAELDRISARNKDKAARLRSQGHWPGGPTPYGRRIAQGSGGHKSLTIDPTEAAIITAAAAALLSGTPLFRIVRDLNASGVPAPGVARAAKSGRAPTSRPSWTTDALRRLLCAPHTVGYSLDGSGEIDRAPDGTPRQHWDPILPPATWHRLRVLLGADAREQRARDRRRGAAPLDYSTFPRPDAPAARILSGILRCGRCGRRLVVRHYRPSTRTPREVYACPDQPQGRCRGLSIEATRAEEFITTKFLTTYGPRRILTPREVDSPTVVRAAEVTAAIAATTRAIGEHFTPTLAARLQALQTERDALARAPRTPSIVWEESPETYAERWSRLDTQGRRDLLRANLTAVIRPSVRRGRHTLADLEARVQIFRQPARIVGYTESPTPGAVTVAP